MYLTRMRLNESNPNTAKALASPHIFHGTVERCFGGERKRNLWRIDHLNHQLYLMLLSPDKPDLSAAAAQFGMLGADCPWETKLYTPLLERITPASVGISVWWPIPQKAVCPNREREEKYMLMSLCLIKKNGCRPVRLTTVFR